MLNPVKNLYNISGRFLYRSLWKSEKFRKRSFLNIIIHIALAFLAKFFGGGAGLDAYISFVIPAFVISQLIITYATAQCASGATIAAIVGLNMLGVLIQSIFGFANQSAVVRMWAVYIMGAVMAVGFAVITRKVRTSLFMSTVIALVLALGCLFSCFFLPSVNGAKNWLSLGFFSIQVTEFAKLFGIMFLGYVYMLKCSDWIKWLISTAFMAVAAFILAKVANELGILLILAATYVCLTFMYAKNNALKLTFGGLILAVAAVAFMLVNHMNAVTYKWECPAGCVEEIKLSDGTTESRTKILHDTLKCDTCGKQKLHYKETFICDDCKFRKFTPLPEGETRATYDCELCREDPVINAPIVGDMIVKFYHRFAVTLKYDIVKYEGSAYQISQGEKSAILGGWFGTREGEQIYIPNIRNDSVVAGAMHRMGFVSLLVMIMLYFVLFLEIRNAKSPKKAAAVLTMCFQALVAISGNLNLFALTGIGVPLISSGGSVNAVSLMLVYIILTSDNGERGGRSKDEI